MVGVHIKGSPPSYDTLAHFTTCFRIPAPDFTTYFTTFHHCLPLIYHIYNFLPLFYHPLSTFYRAEDFPAGSPPEVQNLGTYRADDFTVGSPSELQPFLGIEGVVNFTTFYHFLQLRFHNLLLLFGWVVKLSKCDVGSDEVLVESCSLQVGTYEMLVGAMECTWNPMNACEPRCNACGILWYAYESQWNACDILLHAWNPAQC